MARQLKATTANAPTFASSRPLIGRSSEPNLRKYYTRREEYVKIPAGVTHDTRGREVKLYRQALISKALNPNFEDELQAYRAAQARLKTAETSLGSLVPTSTIKKLKVVKKPEAYIFTAKYDKSWDAYNKAMSEMRHRVTSGVANTRKAELKAKANPFLAGQAQRVAASQKAKQKRAGTLISDQYKL